MHGDPANGTDPTGKSLLAGLGLGLMVGLMMNAQKTSKDVSTGGAAGATATILGFQVNLRTALYLTTAGLLTAAELLRPLAEQQRRETYNDLLARDTLRRLSEGNEPNLELEIQDEKLPRDEAVRLGFINHYETRQDEIPVFVEKLSQLFEVAATDLRAQMQGHAIMLTYHDGSQFFTNNRYEAQKKWKQERGMRVNDPLPLTPYANPTLEEYPFANSMEGGIDAHVEIVDRSWNSLQGGLFNGFRLRHSLTFGSKFIVLVMPQHQWNGRSRRSSHRYSYGKIATWRRWQ